MKQVNWFRQLCGLALVVAAMWLFIPDMWQTLGMRPPWHALQVLTSAYPLCTGLLYSLLWLLDKKGKPPNSNRR